MFGGVLSLLFFKSKSRESLGVSLCGSFKLFCALKDSNILLKTNFEGKLMIFSRRAKISCPLKSNNYFSGIGALLGGLQGGRRGFPIKGVDFLIFQ